MYFPMYFPPQPMKSSIGFGSIVAFIIFCIFIYSILMTTVPDTFPNPFAPAKADVEVDISNEGDVAGNDTNEGDKDGEDADDNEGNSDADNQSDAGTDDMN